VGARDLLEVVGARGEDARADDVLRARAGLVERGDDDLEAALRLP
jgi:hypothetical protein